MTGDLFHDMWYGVGRYTRRVRRFKNPVRFSGICDCLVPPFDLEVAGCLFEERWSGEVVHVEFGFWRHRCEWIEVG